jgi:hypothetical protein
MSALGQKQTLKHVRPMSALPPKADIDELDHHVCFVPKADIRGSTLSHAILKAPVLIPEPEASPYPVLALPFPDRYAG